VLVLVTLVVCLLGAIEAGCGSQGHPTQAVSGPQIFEQAGCGNCHTMAAAHATGNPGPNLDVLKPDVSAVESQVTEGDDAMPSYANKLTPAQIHEVSAYVSQVTRSGGGR
jgi:cytochrome c6